jgi:hypothetical protein
LVLQLAGTRTEVWFDFKNKRLRCVHSLLVAFRNWCPAPVHTNGYLVGNEIGLIYYLLGRQPIGGCSAIDTDSERWIPGFLSLQGRKAFYEAAARAVSAFQSHVLPDPNKRRQARPWNLESMAFLGVRCTFVQPIEKQQHRSIR